MIFDCPRCHGGKYKEGSGFIPPKTQNLTLRIENVMGTTQLIYYRCGNCGYKEKRPYAEVDVK